MDRLVEPLGPTHGVYFDAVQRVVSQRSGFQLIEVFDTPDLGRLMRIDGANMVSERDEYFYHENLIHPAALAHAAPRNVLIVGGGDGGAAEEMLKHPSVERCTLCELDPAVIEIAREHFAAVHRGVFDDPRLHIRIGDGGQLVRSNEAAFELIYLDLTDPHGAAEALYSTDFYQSCKRALGTDGGLVIHVGSPFSHPERVRESVSRLRTVFQHVTPYFVHIPMYGAVWGFAHASDAIDLAAVSEQHISTELSRREIGDRQYFAAPVFKAMQALPVYVQALLAC